MRPYQSFAPLACGVAAAVALASLVVIAPGLVHAGETAKSPSCTCPRSGEPDFHRPPPRPKFASEVRPPLEARDEIATLEAVSIALNEVGDGASYIWHGKNGRLSAIVQPTSSFRDASGKICRHLMITLTSGTYARQAEGIACRLGNGVWQLEG